MNRVIVAKTIIEYYDVDEVTNEWIESIKDKKGKVSIVQNVQVLKVSNITEDSVYLELPEDILCSIDNGISEID